MVTVRVNFQATLSVDVISENSSRVATFNRIVSFKQSCEEPSIIICIDDKAFKISKKLLDLFIITSVACFKI